MYKLKREITFCYGHRLINYPGKCRNLHGHNGKVVLTIASDTLDDLGMVADFADIKKIASTFIDENLDHRLLLHKDDPALSFLQNLGEPVVVMPVNPTAENIAQLIFEALHERGLQVLEVELWETDTCSAAFSGFVEKGGEEVASKRETESLYSALSS